MGLIQAFHQEEEQFKRFTQHNKSYWQANLREIRSNVFFSTGLSIFLAMWLW